MSRGYEKIGQYIIYLDQTYFLCYAGGSRELPEKDKKNWNKTLALPELLMRKEQSKLGHENNPNVIPMTGRTLLMFIKEMKFIPFFDWIFEQTHLVKLTDAIIYESIKQKNYEIAMRND